MKWCVYVFVSVVFGGGCHFSLLTSAHTEEKKMEYNARRTTVQHEQKHRNKSQEVKKKLHFKHLLQISFLLSF